VALSTFLSSVTASQPLVAQLLPSNLLDRAGTNDPTFVAAVLEWEARTGSESVQLPFATEQKCWDEPLLNGQQMFVLSAARDQVSKARLIAAAAPHSGAFLHARPCLSLGTRLDDSSLRIAVALRLGAPICAPHACICGGIVDSTGTHGLSCRKICRPIIETQRR
jgi:hypothetical protein